MYAWRTLTQFCRETYPHKAVTPRGVWPGQCTSPQVLLTQTPEAIRLKMLGQCIVTVSPAPLWYMSHVASEPLSIASHSTVNQIWPPTSPLKVCGWPLTCSLAAEGACRVGGVGP